jgi:hypothetical protein
MGCNEVVCGPPGHHHVWLPPWYYHEAQLDVWQPRRDAIEQQPGRRARPKLRHAPAEMKLAALILDALPAVVRCSANDCRKPNLITAEETGAVGKPPDRLMGPDGPVEGAPRPRGTLLFQN